jgi:hypothetical protein
MVQFGEGIGAGTRCPACGVEAQPDWVFCDSCGASLRSQPAPVGEPAATALDPSAEVTQPMAEVLPLPMPEQPAEERPAFAPAPSDSFIQDPPAYVPVTHTQPGPAPAARDRGRLRLVATAAAVVLVVAALVVGVLNGLGTRDRLSSTRKDLASTTKELTSTKHTLAGTQRDLTARTTALNLARGELADANQQLTGVRQTLADSKAQVNLQAGQISQLRTCINGIASGLQLAATGQFDAGLAAINAVQSACTGAGV